jgi:acetylornithine deacetylase/succinyl-diaminopimelate desuccinylase-like protein
MASTGVASAPDGSGASAIDPEIESQLASTRDERHASYLELLRIPSISTLPEHAPDCRRAAEWVAAELTRIGFEHVDVSPTGGHPIVYADWLHAPGAPTVLVYCHYDVQPVDPIDLWETAPFDPFIKDGRVVGRGSADDKGHLHMHLRAAEAFLATRGKLPINIRMLFEGEEESTSAHLGPWLDANRERLKADAVVISDSGFWEGNLPALTISLRGMVYVQIDVTGSPVDLHSGGYGGMCENPANALALIVSELKGRDGVVRVPGFYDDVHELSGDERADLAALPFDEADFKQRVGVTALAGESGFTPVERGGVRPTLDVNGIWGGFQGEGSKTIIPAHAHAKVSSRLVPNQDPDKILAQLREFIVGVAPPGVHVEVQDLGTGRATLTDVGNPFARAAVKALEKTFGREPVLIRSGGSIPIVALIEEKLGLPLVMLGFANPDDNAHAPNESMVLANYETGIRTVCALWDDLAVSGQRGADA